MRDADADAVGAADGRRFMIRKKQTEDPLWQKPQIVFSGHEVRRARPAPECVCTCIRVLIRRQPSLMPSSAWMPAASTRLRLARHVSCLSWLPPVPAGSFSDASRAVPPRFRQCLGRDWLSLLWSAAASNLRRVGLSTRAVCPCVTCTLGRAEAEVS